MIQKRNSVIMINKSPYGLNETLGQLLKVLIERDMAIFAIVDHLGGAAQVGLSMSHTKLVIFGNPKECTEFMLSNSNFSVDLQLKIIVRKNKNTTLSIRR